MDAKVLEVYTIIEKEGLEHSIWIKVGMAFVNKDESLTIALNALPTNGKLHVRPATKKP